MSIETLIDHLEKCIQEEISFCGTPERENELQKILLEEFLILLQLGQYDEARHLWRRLPLTLSTSPLFQHLWQITSAMMNHDSTLAFSLLFSVNSSNNDQQLQQQSPSTSQQYLTFMKEECKKLENTYRSRVETSLSKCYRKLNISNAMKLLGFLQEDEVVKYLHECGWTKQDKFLISPPPSLRKNRVNISDKKKESNDYLEAKLQSMTEMVMFMEKKRLTV